MNQRSAPVTEAISAIVQRQPFYAMLLIELLKIIEDEGMPDPAATDGQNLFLKPSKFAGWTIMERIFVLAHECLHVIMEHCPRLKLYIDRGCGPDLKPFNMEKANRAMDYIINALLVAGKVGTMPNEGLYSPNITGNEIWDELYEKLPDKPPQQSQSGQGQGQAGQGQMLGGSGFDRHMPAKSPQAGQKGAHSKATIQRALKSAEAAAKSRGLMPAGMQRLVDEICEAQVPWAEIVQRLYMGTAGRNKVTMKKPNKRRIVIQPHPYLPSRAGSSSGPVAVEIDTSGSISDRELSVFLSELHGLFTTTKPKIIYVFFVDAALYKNEVIEVTDVNELLDLKQKAGGGGGTDMEVMFREIEARELRIEQCIVFTDGYCNFGNDIGIPTIWCITNKDITSSWGDTVHVRI